MLRRNLLSRSAIAGAAALTLSACKGQTAQQTIQVTLAVAQAESTTIFQALSLLGKSLSPQVQAAIQGTLASLNGAVSSFTTATADGTWQTAAQAVIADASAVLSVVGPLIPAPSLVAINAGLGILAALVAGTTVVTVPAPSANVGATPASRTISGPIPIPLS